MKTYLKNYSRHNYNFSAFIGIFSEGTNAIYRNHIHVYDNMAINGRDNSYTVIFEKKTDLDNFNTPCIYPDVPLETFFKGLNELLEKWNSFDGFYVDNHFFSNLKNEVLFFKYNPNNQYFHFASNYLKYRLTHNYEYFHILEKELEYNYHIFQNLYIKM